MSFNLEFLAKSRISSRNFRFFRLNFVGILEFPSLVSSPDLTLGSHHKEFRIPHRDPRVKLGDDIVGNSKIPII